MGTAIQEFGEPPHIHTVASREESYQLIERSLATVTQKNFMRSTFEHGQAFLHDFGNGPVCILDVSEILNHAVEVPLVRAMAREMKQKLDGIDATVALTAASGGNILTYLLSEELKLPRMISAAKSPNVIHQHNGYIHTGAKSYTGGHDVELTIAKKLLNPDDRVLVVDDFLDTGDMTTKLLNLVEEAGATPVGFAFAVNKEYAGGHRKIQQFAREYGVPDHHVVSFIAVTYMDDGVIQFEGIPKAFRFLKQPDVSPSSAAPEPQTLFPPQNDSDDFILGEV